MLDRVIKIRAGNEKEALKRAADAFDTSVHNIRLEETGRGKFQASLVNADAAVSVEISKDGMFAVVTGYAPPVGEGKPLSPEILKRQLESAGILQPPDQEGSEILFKRIAQGKDIKETVISQGAPPEEVVDARIEFFGDMTCPVFREEIFGRKIPPREAKPGVTVDGRPIPPKEERRPKDIEISAKSGCVMDPETLEIYSRGYGRVSLKKDRVVVKPWMKISEDKLRITAAIHHKDFKGNAITKARIRAALEIVGVTTGIDEAAIEEALAASASTGTPRTEVVIAVGKAPVHGKDGRFDLASQSRNADGDEGNLGEVDHRERSIFQSVKQGSVIGKIVPPKEGWQGVDVFGQIILPRKGKAVDVRPGDNVDISPDGLEFRAAATGMISWEGVRLSVLEVLIINGDVNYSTGNVRLEKGSVKVTGTVTGGFTIVAPGDIVVQETIEGAYLDAGGSVEARGGILMGGAGRIKAKVDVRFQFAEGAVITAGGDVIAVENISNSDIRAGGRVICTRGKGILLGGTIRAVSGVDVNEIGSEFGVATNIILGPDLEGEDNQQLLEERRISRQKMRRIVAALGADDPRAILERTPPEKRKKVAELLKVRIAEARRCNEIDQILEEKKKARLKDFTQARVRARRAAHPGTAITVAGKTFLVKEPLQSSLIYFNPQMMDFEVL